MCRSYYLYSCVGHTCLNERLVVRYKYLLWLCFLSFGYKCEMSDKLCFWNDRGISLHKWSEKEKPFFDSYLFKGILKWSNSMMKHYIILCRDIHWIISYICGLLRPCWFQQVLTLLLLRCCPLSYMLAIFVRCVSWQNKHIIITTSNGVWFVF